MVPMKSSTGMPFMTLMFLNAWSDVRSALAGAA
jgi:hypothetical protein